MLLPLAEAPDQPGLLASCLPHGQRQKGGEEVRSAGSWILLWQQPDEGWPEWREALVEKSSVINHLEERRLITEADICPPSSFVFPGFGSQLSPGKVQEPFERVIC